MFKGINPENSGNIRLRPAKAAAMPKAAVGYRRHAPPDRPALHPPYPCEVPEKPSPFISIND